MSKFYAIFMMSILIYIAGCRSNDERHLFSIADAMNSPDAKAVLDPSIEVRFAQNGGKIIKKNLISRKKSNGAGKKDVDACNRAFLSAVKQFQEQARKQGARKVVNLISYYNKVPYSSSKYFECYSGNLMSGVVLKGDLAR